MRCFLTSSPFGVGSPFLNPANGFIDRLRAALPRPAEALFVCSDPDVPLLTDRFALDMRRALEAAGFSFSGFSVLDGRNARDAACLVRGAGLIVLAGGHVPTQNAFFAQIGLRYLLTAWEGTLIGISAGSMNCADPVYAQPERAGEAASAVYRRFLPGLGLTQTMLLPHYQLVKNDVVDGLRVFEDVAFPDSRGRRFFAIPDGSYLMIAEDGRETLMGEAWLIEDGAIRRVSAEGDALPVPR